MDIQIIPVCFEQDVTPDTNLAELIAKKVTLLDGDIIIVSQKVISKMENQLVLLDDVVPSLLAQGIASQYEKDARLVELILQESKRIVRMDSGKIIVETKHGFVCANAGIDQSNVPLGYATLLPIDSDASARTLREQIAKCTGCTVAVLVSDTFGRPFRVGQTDCAIGIAGINAIQDYKGSVDSMGRTLHVSEIAIADEICAAAELVKTKSDGCPVALVRNFEYAESVDSITSLLREPTHDMFR